jgi:hypothetical protein
MNAIQPGPVMEPCPFCDGTGEVEEWRDAHPTEANGGLAIESRYVVCECCCGSGVVPCDA